MSDPNAACGRRELLKATGTAVVGLASVSVSAGAAADESGSGSDAIVISEPEDIREMAASPGEAFVLDSDIDASGLGTSGDGFRPIEDFAGTLDGQGHEISGLVIDRDESKAGLFANTTKPATIENVGVVDVDIVGGTDTGGLVGRNLGTIERAHTGGRVQANGIGTGGVVGHHSGTITESFTTATVAGDIATGGAVGWSNATIQDCYAVGDVQADPSAVNVGGFVGDNRGTVERCYAAVRTSGTDAGGFSGSAVGSVENGCYWDTDVSGLTTTKGSAYGLTTGRMTGDTATANMSAFDYQSTWRDPAQNGGYPTLQFEDVAASSCPTVDGTQTSDLDGDGLCEDLDGDGQAGMADVLTYYNKRERSAVRNDAAAFDFDGDGTAGTVFDAISLYADLS